MGFFSFELFYFAWHIIHVQVNSGGNWTPGEKQELNPSWKEHRTLLKVRSQNKDNAITYQVKNGYNQQGTYGDEC